MTKVTALVSAYYAAEYLEGRLENLLAQDLGKDLQIVVVCQHKSLENDIAFDFMVKNKPGMVIQNTPDIPTVYEAWNIGIRHATGAYLTNANCDDRLYPGALATLAEALDTHPRAAVTYGNVNEVSVLGGETVGTYEWLEGGLAELLTGCFLGPMPMWRKALHDTYGLFDPAYHSAGDYEFWLRLAAHGETFHKVAGFTGAYLNRPESAAHRKPVLSAWETARARSTYRDFTHSKRRSANQSQARPGQTAIRLGDQPLRLGV